MAPIPLCATTVASDGSSQSDPCNRQKEDGMSERKIRRYALPRCVQRRVYVDIGASIGETCHPFIGEFDSIHAFEPNPESFAQLIQTPGAHYHAEALSDGTSTATLIVPRPTRNPEHGSIDPTRQSRWDTTNTTQYTVETRTLDSYDLQQVDLIKIDVEQHERAVIRGAMRTIERCCPVIMIENKRGENLAIIEDLALMPYKHTRTKSEIIWYPS
jgi:FkbM family methyltransferase